MKNKIFFYLFLSLTFLCLIFTWAEFGNKNLINIIIETKVENNDDILLKIDDKYYIPPQFNNVLNQTINKKINSAEILIKQNFKNKIKNIVIFNDAQMYQYQDFSKFQKSKEKICVNDGCKNYYKYKLKDETIVPKGNKLYLFTNSLAKFDKIFYPFFALLILTIFYGYKLKLNKFILPICILFLAIILRLSDINSFEPWGDECYSISISKTNLPFLNLFNDPGNPPFYFFLLRILQYFTDSVVCFRLLSLVFSVLGGIFLYLFLNKNFSNKIATITVFLYAINLPLIYFAQEIRCYSLQLLLAILIFICVFEIIKKRNNKKYWLLYGILTIIAVNTHYFQVIFAFVNFLYLAFYFIKGKRKEDLIWLFSVNLLALLAFLPYYLITAHNKALLDASFNSYIEPITFKLIKKCVLYIFGGIISLSLTIIFFFKKTKIALKNNEFYSYSFWTIFLVIFMAIVLSLIIRPMYAGHYTLFLIPFILIILATIFASNYKNKWIILFFIFCVFSMQNYSKNSYINLRYVTANNHNAFKLAHKSKTKTNEVVVISKASDAAVKKLYGYDEIDLITLPKYNSHELLNMHIRQLKEKNKNVLIFTPLLKHDKENSMNKNYTCYFNSSRDLCIWKIE